MCVVSAVLNHGMGLPQLDLDYWSKQIIPNPPIPSVWWPTVTPDTQPNSPMHDKTTVVKPEPVLDRDTIIKEFLKLVKQAAVLDEAANQKDCEDPEKVKFLEKLLTKLDTIDQELLDLKKEVRSLLKLDGKVI